jgi:hypothetical protein
MLEAIELWASNAAYKHLTKGHHLNNEVVAKDLKVLAELAKRLKNDDYNDPWFLPDYESEHFSVPIEGSDLIELKTKNYKVVYNNPERKETIDSNEETVYKIIKLKGKHHKRQREQALEMFCNLIKRKLFNWWD